MKKKTNVSEDGSVTLYLFYDTSIPKVDVSIYVDVPADIKEVIPAKIITNNLDYINYLLANASFPYYELPSSDSDDTPPPPPSSTPPEELDCEKDKIATLISFIYSTEKVKSPPHVEYFNFSFPCIPHQVFIQGPGGTGTSKVSEIAD
jgi:hypothetical protein